MKLFITNKKKFENSFDFFDAQNFSSKEIHKFLYNQLLESVSTKNSIPFILLQEIDNEGVEAEFRFKGYNNDIYFYEFNQIINV
jgi:TFIIF-interacting CTD phosphatase-like protein